MQKELYDLTNPQKSIWVTEQFYKNTPVNNICGTVLINEVVNFNNLIKAIDFFVQTNDSFRIKLLFDKNNEIKQYFSDSYNLDLSNIALLESNEDLENIQENLVNTPFTLIDSQLFNFKLFKFSKNGHGGFVLNIHHLIGDACTAGLVGSKIINIYTSLQKNEDITESATSYKNYIESEKAYLSSSKFEKDKEYWNKIFETIPEIGNIPSIKQENKNTCKALRKTFIIPKEQIEKINNFCSSNKISLFNFFMALYAIYVEKVSGLDDFVLGTPILNRSTFVEKNTPGMFISTVPFRFTLSEDLSFIDFAKKIAFDSLGIFRHQKYPYQNILEDIRKKNPEEPNLYDILISYQNTKTNRNDAKVPYEVRWTFNNNIADSMQIHLFDMNDEGILNISYDYRSDKYNEEDIFSIHERICFMINQVLTCDSLLTKDINIVTDKEKDIILNEFNNTFEPYCFSNSIIEMIENVAKNTPNNIAIETDNSSITYKDLILRINQLSNYLLKTNISENSNIGIFTSRTIDTIVGILSILKINCTYVPIDPEYPIDRISYMVETSKINYILSEDIIHFDKISDIDNLEKISINFSKYKDEDISFAKTYDYNNNSNLYIIFTSGSTGKPKGVTISHKNMMNLILFEKNKTNLLKNANNKILQFATMSFDVSYQEIYSALLFGNTLVLIDEASRKDMNKLSKYIFDKRINTLFIPPAYLKLLVEDKDIRKLLISCIKNIITAGEALVITDGMIDLINAGIQIHNHYGPAETHVATTYVVDKNNISSYPPIGKPISNANIHILDKNLKLCPIGVIGQIAISGDCVGNGYLNNINLTNEKFITNSYNNKKMYLTGDLGFFDKNGNVHFIGRSDFQIKLNGFRVELEEINQVLLKHPSIKSSVTIIHEENNKKYIIAYYVEEHSTKEEELIRYLKTSLPFYMIPKKLILMDNLPINTNGKIDKTKLPKFDLVDIEEEYIAPSTSTELRLAKIWQSLFNSNKIGANYNFFDIGGDSLLAIKLCSIVLSEFNVNISVTNIYNTPYLKDLANYIDSCKQVTSKFIINKTPKMDSYPLSSAEKRIYYACKAIGENHVVYNIPAAFLIDKVLDTKKVNDVFHSIILNNSVFRTCFKIIDNEPRQFILDKVDFNIEIYNCKESEVESIISNFSKPFDLETAPLLRVCLYYLDNNKTLLLIDSHHIIMDGVSLNNLVSEFCELYQGNNITKLDLEYVDYSVWENDFNKSTDIQLYEKYWINQFKDKEIPVINLPYDYPVSQSKGYEGKIIFNNVEQSFFAKLELLAKKHNVSSYMLFLAAFYATLYKYTSQENIIVGTPIASRYSDKLQNIIGMFVNIMPLKIEIPSNNSFSDLLSIVKDMVLSSFENQPYPYDMILKKSGINTNSSILDVMFTYQNINNNNFIINGSKLEMIYSNTNTAKYNLSVGIIPNTYTFYIEYNSNLFREETINSFLEHYLFVLEQILDNEHILLSNINKITPKEEKLLLDFNKTDGPINDDTVVSIFEEQVRNHSNDIALICEDKMLTYEELNKKSNSLAHLLIQSGIGANDIVCIMTNRSLETIVCMMAILKAGAAFFNVDPTYPIERTKYYIETSKTKYVLTQSCLKDKVSQIENCIEIDLDKDDIYNKNFDNPNIKIGMNDLSYIIFTSGSTGKPKGVMLNQVGFANMVKAMTLALDYLKEGNKHTIASVTSTPFDIFVYEIIVSLTHGLRVVMANNAEHRNPKLLDSLIRKYNIDVMTVTPSLMKINYDNREPNSALALVKNMVFGGEPLPEKFVQDLKSLANDITIYNIYGPSEITILSNVQNLEGEKEITIGPPILNTQIYILDKDMKQVPIGVTGEIYIAGIQVGLGYLENPELTAEKFLDNPFGEGKIYKSGDIGRWTFDGKVQCLGRLDHQIKLRGLRIELGEIENQMTAVEGVSASVVNKIEIDGKEVLCGYYVADKNVLESTIKEHLRKNLPAYMVPTYIVRLDSMPYTLNRKIDRKALPLPELKQNISSSIINIKDLNSDEEKLMQIWKNILKIDDINIDDNFFDIGGDSISAINMQIEALKYGLNFEYADIFNYPTIRDLCNNIQSPITSLYHYDDYDKINNILSRNVISNIPTITKANIKNILLIGSTGFLGIHILDAFLRQETGNIYCLVRSKNNIKPLERLKSKFSFYFDESYFDKYINRIKILEGDITEQNLGLTDEQILELKNNVNIVINSGAIVKHFGQIDLFEKINVNGTQNVVDFCKNQKMRLLHISTISVSGNGEKEETIVETPENMKYKKLFKETSLYIHQNIKGIYAVTKYKAECIILEAISDGLDAQILRIGNITSRYSDGLFQENIDENAFAKKIKSFIEISAFPDYLLKHSIELTPVDLCANAIIKILEHNSLCNVFHLYNTKLLPIKLLADTLHEFNIELYPISDKLLADVITGILEDNSRKSILSGIIHDLDKNKHLVYTSNVKLDCSFTEDYLKAIGFEWSPIDKEYVIKYMNYFNKIGFIDYGKEN